MKPTYRRVHKLLYIPTCAERASFELGKIEYGRVQVIDLLVVVVLSLITELLSPLQYWSVTSEFS